MKPLRFLLAFLLAALPAAAEDSLTTVVVPVVGSIFGPGNIRWLTDVEVVNDTGAPADVALELTAGPGSPAILISLAPGEGQRFTDIVGQAFGLDTVLSPLRVTTSGRRSVTVRAAAYAVSATGVSPVQPLAVYPAQSFVPARILDGLAFSEQFRTNIGLVNFSDDAADFVLALQRIEGRNLAVSYIRVEPGVLLQTSIQSIFPMISKGEEFSVIIETAAPDTYVYASRIDNARQAGVFIAPRIGAR